MSRRNQPRATAHARNDNRRLVLIGLPILFAGLMAYAGGLSAPFIYDDIGVVRDNLTIRQVWSALSPPAIGNPMSGRPIVNLSMAINYAIGELDPRGYHAANLAIHIVCALLMFGIVRRTLNTMLDHRTSLLLAYVSACLWTVHPLNSEVVLHISARTESLMAACYLLTLYTAIRAMPSRTLWTALSVAACAVGMACKESMITAPVMVALYDRVFVTGPWSETVRMRRWLYAGLASTWALLAYLNWSGPRGHSAGFIADTGLATAASPTTYLANQMILIPHYLRLAVWPTGLVFDYGMIRPLSMGDVAGYATAVVVALAIIAVLVVTRPKWGFLGTWFVMTLAPASSVVPIHTEVGAERRMYLPLMALILGAALIAFAMIRRFVTNDRIAIIGGTVTTALVFVSLVALTDRRSAEYGSPLKLWSSVIERWPHGRAHYNLAMALKGDGRQDEAISELRIAARELPEVSSVLGVELLDSGHNDEGIKELESFISQRPDHPNVVIAHGRLADALFAKGNYAAAIPEYRAYLTVRPQFASGWTNLGICLAATGDPADAVGAFRRAASIEPASGDAHRNLANALLEVRDFQGAADEAREATRLAPRDAVAREILELATAGQRASNKVR